MWKFNCIVEMIDGNVETIDGKFENMKEMWKLIMENARVTVYLSCL